MANAQVRRGAGTHTELTCNTRSALMSAAHDWFPARRHHPSQGTTTMSGTVSSGHKADRQAGTARGGSGRRWVVAGVVIVVVAGVAVAAAAGAFKGSGSPGPG